MKTLPQIGDRVVVPFGGGELQGEVVDVSTTLSPPAVMVEVWLTGMTEPIRSTFRADRIRPAEPVKQ